MPERKSMEGIQSKRIVVSLEVPNRELRKGFTQVLAENTHSILGAEKVVVTSVTANAISSDCAKTVAFGMNIGNGRPNAESCGALSNSAGDLYHPVVTDLAQEHESTHQGYQTILSMMPFENYRGKPVVCYSPNSELDDRIMSEYGSLSLQNLWEGKCVH
ncbi:hypothetical protein OAU26_03710 [Mariniblastus sp.]|nr:hypothetical protein [Mariniblastus sp.]